MPKLLQGRTICSKLSWSTDQQLLIPLPKLNDKEERTKPSQILAKCTSEPKERTVTKPFFCVICAQDLPRHWIALFLKPARCRLSCMSNALSRSSWSATISPPNRWRTSQRISRHSLFTSVLVSWCRKPASNQFYSQQCCSQIITIASYKKEGFVRLGFFKCKMYGLDEGDEHDYTPSNRIGKVEFTQD